MIISAHIATNVSTGNKRYYHDGHQVSYSAYSFAAILAHRVDCLFSTESRGIRRDHATLHVNRNRNHV